MFVCLGSSKGKSSRGEASKQSVGAPPPTSAPPPGSAPTASNSEAKAPATGPEGQSSGIN